MFPLNRAEKKGAQSSLTDAATPKALANSSPGFVPWDHESTIKNNTQTALANTFGVVEL